MADDRWRDEDWRRGDDDRNRYGRQRYGQSGGYAQEEQRPYHEHPESQSQWDERPGYAQDQRRRYGEGGSRYGGYGSESWRGGYGEGGTGRGWSGTGGWTGGGYGGGYLGGRGSPRSGYGDEGQDWSGGSYGSGYGGEGFGSRYGGYGRGHGGSYGGSYGRGQDWPGSSYGEGWAGGRQETGYGRGREQDRSWFDRATDEVSSWFGDEDAERRRRRDQERGHYGKGPRGYSRSDERIREDVNDRLTDDWQVDASEIEVIVTSGEVTLNGTVSRREEKRRAEDLAENVSGVRHVQNNLRVQNQGTGLASTEASTTTGVRIKPSGSTSSE